jgi:hypothetical protein
MSMDKPSFRSQGDLSARPGTEPGEDDDVDGIKGAVLAKPALELGKDASVDLPILVRQAEYAGKRPQGPWATWPGP